MSSSILLYHVIVGYMRRKSKKLKNIRIEERAEKTLVVEKDLGCTTGFMSSEMP